MKDSYGREIDYLRISLTEKCNLSCVFCKDENYKIEEIEEVLDVEDFKFIIKNFSQMGIKKVKFVEGNPILYPYIKELIHFAKYKCNMEDVSITTNGYGFCENAKELKECGLDRVNFSINSLKEYRYNAITRGGNLKEVLNALNMCEILKIPVKVNCMLIDEFNTDEIMDFILLARHNYIDVRFTELSPYGNSRQLYKYNYVNTKELIESLIEVDENDFEDEESVRYYNIKYLKGRVGVISPNICGFCNNCNKLIITHDGFIRLCLLSDEDIGIKGFLHKPTVFREMMKSILNEKPKCQVLL